MAHPTRRTARKGAGRAGRRGGPDRRAWALGSIPYLSPPTRVAIHEVGHGAVSLLLHGTTEDVYVFADEGGTYGGYQPVSPSLAGVRPTTRDGLRDAIAAVYGGWAAVHLAVARGHVPHVPDEETEPGDVGFLGPFPADQGQVKRWATQSGVVDPEGLVGEARALALGLLGPRIDALWALADLAVGRGYVTEGEIREACGP